jgi:hypothetical protein
MTRSRSWSLRPAPSRYLSPIVDTVAQYSSLIVRCVAICFRIVALSGAVGPGGIGNPLGTCREARTGLGMAASTRSGHLEGSSIKKQHAKALRASNVLPFVLYSLRHTFLTRLGESGCDVWTLARRLDGHTCARSRAQTKNFCRFDSAGIKWPGERI